MSLHNGRIRGEGKASSINNTPSPDRAVQHVSTARSQIASLMMGSSPRRTESLHVRTPRALFPHSPSPPPRPHSAPFCPASGLPELWLVALFLFSLWVSIWRSIPVGMLRSVDGARRPKATASRKGKTRGGQREGEEGIVESQPTTERRCGPPSHLDVPS